MDNLPQRKQIRLKDYDYTKPGYYYITICTQHKEKLFGQVVGADSISARGSDGISIPFKMVLNNAGRMVEKVYANLQHEFENIRLHEYIIMPNHIHGIIQKERADIESAPTVGLPAVIQTFKRQTTVAYINGVKKNIFPPFNQRIWQRGYYEHIIRTEEELEKTREYIVYNPAKWQDDRYFN